jgi:REP element-mobilizing transposase RayT
MGNPCRIETADYAHFITTRTMNSLLWFVNNPLLQETILGHLARCVHKYEARLYGASITGNHIHLLAHFPKPNRADFMRSFNSSVAFAVRRLVENFPGGKLWERPYSIEFVPGAPDIEREFFYVALQPVQDGLVSTLGEYPGYHFFGDAACGITRTYYTIDWKANRRAKKKNPGVLPPQFRIPHTLTYTRLPGKENLSPKEYRDFCEKALERHRQEILVDRERKGHKGFAGRAAILATRPGAGPHRTKRSDINSFRPRFHCVCPIRRRIGLAWYHEICSWYKRASAEYRAGNLSVRFPPGTYPPHRRCLDPAPGDPDAMA